MFLSKDCIVVLFFPPKEWIPTAFNIKSAEEKIDGLEVNVDKGVWSLDEREALIGDILFRPPGFFLEQLIGVYDLLKTKSFEFTLHNLIRKRKELFLSIVSI